MSYTDFLCDRPPSWVGSVWKKYSYRIYKLCLQKCASKEDAEDLFQEVALRFCKKAKELNNKKGLYAWFQTVLLNCHYSIYRKKMDRMVPLSSLHEHVCDYDCMETVKFVVPDEKISSEALMNEFSLLLDELNPLERMIVELSVVGDIGIRDLSRLIGLSKVNIIARRNEAFEKMKLKMMAQKENYRMFWGRDASLSEIIGSPK